MLRRGLAAGIAALLRAAAARAQSSPWAPDRPVRFVVGFPPGGSAHALARRLAEPLGRLLGQRGSPSASGGRGWEPVVVVDNRPGAGANIAMDIVVTAPPDGHTVGLGPVGPHAVNPALLGPACPTTRRGTSRRCCA